LRRDEEPSATKGKIRIEPAVYGFFTTPNVQFAHFFRADIFINEFAIEASELSFECHQYTIRRAP